MKNCIRLGLLCACVLSAEPNFSGVWKADLEKSKLPGGPRPNSYLMIVEHSGPKITQKVGVWSERGGERRSMFAYDTASGAKPSMNAERGIPMRTKVSWEGETLVLDSVLTAARGPVKRHETWALAGNMLTINSTSTMNNQNMNTALVLEKQPDDAGEPLRKPEQTAGQRFKNIKVLKDTPASAFLDSMGSFTLALGKNCEFCHVKGKDDLDDKKEKATARKMIEMTHAINAQNFEGKNEVRCYTCHKGVAHPAARPEFPE